MAPLIIGPNLARALREQAGFDVTGHPDVIVSDPFALDIEVRPSTVERMRLEEEGRRAGHALLRGEIRRFRHDI